jgi:hypothetical protein
VYGQIKLPGTAFAQVGTVTVSALVTYVGIAVLYAVAYSAFSLALGMLSFSRRELGGAEG